MTSEADEGSNAASGSVSGVIDGWLDGATGASPAFEHEIIQQVRVIRRSNNVSDFILSSGMFNQNLYVHK